MKAVCWRSCRPAVKHCTRQEQGAVAVPWLNKWSLGSCDVVEDDARSWGWWCTFTEGAPGSFVKPVVGIWTFAFIYSSLYPRLSPWLGNGAECVPPSAPSSPSSAVMVQTHPYWWVKPIQQLMDWSERDVDPYFPSPRVDAARVGHMWAFCLTSHSRGFSPWELPWVRAGEGP